MDKLFKVLIVMGCWLLFLACARAEEVLTWQECVKEAAKNHPDLISAQESIKESEAGQRAVASSLMPQIDSQASRSTSASNSKDSAGSSVKRSTDSYSYGVTGSQLIFDGFKTIDNVKAAGQNIKASQYNYKFTSAEVRLRLRAAFISLLRSQMSLGITEDIRNLRRSDYELITLRYQSGIEHKGALMTSEANLAQAEYEITQANRALAVAQRQLTKEMGRQHFAAVRAEGDFKVADPVAERPDFEALARNNPNLGKLAAQTNAAFFGIKSAGAAFWPSLSAQGGADRSGSRWPPRDKQWDAALTLSFPIMQGGLRMAELNLATAAFNQAKANQRSTLDGIVLTLEQAWAALQDAVQTVQVQKKFLDAAQERANIAEAQYSLGLIQFDNWTIIQDDLVSQKKALLNAQASALLAEANWIQAKGDTLEHAN